MRPAPCSRLCGRSSPSSTPACPPPTLPPPSSAAERPIAWPPAPPQDVSPPPAWRGCAPASAKPRRPWRPSSCSSPPIPSARPWARSSAAGPPPRAALPPSSRTNPSTAWSASFPISCPLFDLSSQISTLQKKRNQALLRNKISATRPRVCLLPGVMHELTVCWGFVGTTLGATAAWVYFLRDRGFAFLSYAMFFPALFAALFSLALEDGTIDLLRRLANVDQEVLLYCAAGLGGEAATIFGSAAAGMLLGWARKSSGRKGGEVHPHNRELAQAFLRAAGEELGWRSFMVPLLLRHYSPVATCAISGIVTGGYEHPIHLPCDR